MLHQLLAGLANGMIYASLALALVMIHQATHLLNFAQGEMAMFSTFIAWTLVEAGVPYWIAFAATVACAFATGVAVQLLVIRHVKGPSVLPVVVVFVGLLVIFNSVAGWLFGTTVRAFPSPFPAATSFGQPWLSAHELGAALVTLMLLALVFVFFRFTPLGLAMRAVAQDPVSSRLVGIRVGRMLALGWGLAAAVGAVAGMMVAPVVYLEPNMMSGILLYAFAAALLGGIDSPAGAVLGGLLIGVMENLLGVYVVGNELKLVVALGVIVIVLIVLPAGLLGTPRHSRV